MTFTRLVTMVTLFALTAACSDGGMVTPFSPSPVTVTAPLAGTPNTTVSPVPETVTPQPPAPTTPTTPGPATGANPPTTTTPPATPVVGTNCNQPGRGMFTFSDMPGFATVQNSGPNSGEACTNDFYYACYHATKGADNVDGQKFIPGSEAESLQLKPGAKGTFTARNANFLEDYLKTSACGTKIEVQCDTWMKTRGDLHNTAGGKVYKIQTPACPITPPPPPLPPACDLKATYTRTVNTTSVVVIVKVTFNGPGPATINWIPGAAEKENIASGTSVTLTYTRSSGTQNYLVTVYNKQVSPPCTTVTFTVEVPKLPQ